MSFRTLIRDVTTLCCSRKVKSIEPISQMCEERYPCEGHDGALITFENGETMKYECSSVDLGIIMYYYSIDDDHFTEYVDEDLRKQLDDIEINNKNDYWLGPYNIRIPNSIEDVRSTDGCNMLSKDGSETERFIRSPSPSEKEYKEKYAKLVDGIWYYKID